MAQGLTDLTGFRTTSTAGGGLIGVALYIPTAFLFSNIGELTIMVLSILEWAHLVSPWSLFTIAEFFSEGFEPNGGKGTSVEKRNALSNKKKKLAKRLRKRLD